MIFSNVLAIILVAATFSQAQMSNIVVSGGAACPAGYQVASKFAVAGAATISDAASPTSFDLEIASDIIFYNVDEHGSTSFLNGAIPSGESVVYASSVVVILVTPTPLAPSEITGSIRTTISSDRATVASSLADAPQQSFRSAAADFPSLTSQMFDRSISLVVFTASSSANSSAVDSATSRGSTTTTEGKQSAVSMYSGPTTFLTTWNSNLQSSIQIFTDANGTMGSETLSLYTNGRPNTDYTSSENTLNDKSLDRPSQISFSTIPTAYPDLTLVVVRSVTSTETSKQQILNTATILAAASVSDAAFKTSMGPQRSTTMSLNAISSASSVNERHLRSLASSSTQGIVFIGGPGPVILPSTWQLDAPTPVDTSMTTAKPQSMSNKIPGDETVPAWSLA